MNQNREVFIYQYYLISMAKQGIRWSVLSDFKTVDKCSQKQLPLLEKHVYLFKKYNLKVHLV